MKEEEKHMDIESFCTYMKDEMKSWKAKSYDLIRNMEKMSMGPDEKRAASIAEMGAIIERVEQILKKLETECPANWDSEKAELDNMICDIKERWREASAASPDDFD
jgi:hypothetical protein